MTSPADQLRAAKLTMDDHIFRWFNQRYPDLMAECLTDAPLPPACMKCEAITGNATCFPGPCVFFHERSTPGTKAFNIAALDRVRRGFREPIRAATDLRSVRQDAPQSPQGDDQ